MSRIAHRRGRGKRQAGAANAGFSPSRYLAPHTSEWFARLAAFNPSAAMHTATLVRLAGRADVCSFCGQRPAPICYAADASGAAVRACAACLARIRATPFRVDWRVLTCADLRGTNGRCGDGA